MRRHARRAHAAVGGAPSTLRAGRRSYGLPDDGDKDGWRAMLLPYAGRLQLVDAPGHRCKAVRAAKRVLHGGARPHAPVDVWLHCGLYYRDAAGGDAEPVPGQPLPTANGARRGWRFFPLPRDAPDGTRSFDVRVEPGGGGQAGTRTGAGWVICLVSMVEQPANPRVEFVAATKEVADEWARQIALRAAPLSLVWQRVLAGGGEGEGSTAGSSARPRVGRVRALADAVASFFDSDVPTAVAGVTTAVLCGGIFDAVMSAGPCVAFVVGTLSMAVRVCTATAALGGVAEDLRREVGCLLETLRSHLLPAIVCCRAAGSANAAALLAEVGVVAGALDTVTGKLFHLSLSLGARLHQALSARGEAEALALVEEVTLCKAAVADLRQNIHLNLTFVSMKLAAENREQTVAAARDVQSRALTDAREWLAVPAVSGPIVAQWDDAHADQPWCRLLQVVLREPPPSAAGTSACIVCASGMAGVGKTTVSQLVAARVAAEGVRYPDGVYWLSLGQGVTEERAAKYMMAVTTCVTRREVPAPSIVVAAARLRHALEGKGALIVVDDCWDDELAKHFVSAVGGGAQQSALHHSVGSRCPSLFPRLPCAHWDGARAVRDGHAARVCTPRQVSAAARQPGRGARAGQATACGGGAAVGFGGARLVGVCQGVDVRGRAVGQGALSRAVSHRRLVVGLLHGQLPPAVC